MFVNNLFRQLSNGFVCNNVMALGDRIEEGKETVQNSTDTVQTAD